MYNRYRLTSTVYDREDEAQKIIPEKRVFLSVEGNVTEKEYFDGLSKNRVKIGINAKVDVEVLRRGKNMLGLGSKMRMIFYKKYQNNLRNNFRWIL